MAGIGHTVGIEQPHRPIQPSCTPPLPSETATLTGSGPVGPDLLFNPGANELEASAGVTKRKVTHPPAQDRIDLLDHPMERLGLRTLEYLIESTEQRGPLC